MHDEATHPRRPRFSMKALLAVVTIAVVGLGGWIAYSKYKLRELQKLRTDGAIVILRDQTPQALQSIGIRQLSPFYEVPTVELYVTSVGDQAYLGDSETAMPVAEAKERIAEQAATARSYGANDIQLIFIGQLTGREWMVFAEENRLTVISENKNRYLERLRANRESGANIDPQGAKSSGSQPSPANPTPANGAPPTPTRP